MREDAFVSKSGSICGACHRFRLQGNRNEMGDVFICAECQADAVQLFAIQDSIWGDADQVVGETSTSEQ